MHTSPQTGVPQEPSRSAFPNLSPMPLLPEMPPATAAALPAESAPPTAPPTATAVRPPAPTKPPGGRDWLSQVSAQKQAAAASAPPAKAGAAANSAPPAKASAAASSAPPVKAAGISAEAAAGRDGNKRRELGKRKLAEDEARLERSARACKSALQPPTAAELDAIEHTPGSIVFVWHYADGATSARPRDVPKDHRFDPWREAVAIGASLLAVPFAAPPAANTSSQPSSHPSSQPSASMVPSVPMLASIGCMPLRTSAASALPPATTPPVTAPPVTAPMCVHWRLPARLTAAAAAAGGGGGDGSAMGHECEARAEQAWSLICRLLSGEGGACTHLIATNAKLVLRTHTLLVQSSTSTEHGGGPRGVARALSRWMDPLALSWLLEPDATEEDLLLPRLMTQYLPPPAAELLSARGGVSVVSADGGSAEACTDVGTELQRVFDLAVALHTRLRALMHPAAITRVQRREIRIAELLASMELAGLPLEPEVLTRHSVAVSERLRALTASAEALLHAPINLASAHQVSEALHVTLGLPKPTQSDAAARSTHGSTSESHLTDLVHRRPDCLLPSIVLEHRELSKLVSTFLEPLASRAVADRAGHPAARAAPQPPRAHNAAAAFWARAGLSNPADQGTPRSAEAETPSDARHLPPHRRRLYTTWHTHSTGTGRLSSRHPNVQQLPKGATALRAADSSGGSDGGVTVIAVRDAFRAPSGRVLISADYSQLEMRLMGAMAQDPQLTRLLADGGDTFRALTASWQGKAPDAVTPEERQQTKQLCYGMLYGLGVERLADSLQLSAAQARTLKTSFLASFATLHRFIERLKGQARRCQSVSTIAGRCRPLPHINGPNPAERAKAERQAVNSTIQGSAADLMKEAMLRATDEIARRGLDARLVAQLHDEVLFEVADADAPTCAEVVRRAMEDVGDVDGFQLPRLPVNVSQGQAWGRMEAV